MIFRSLIPPFLVLAAAALAACGDRAPAPRADAGAGAPSCTDPGVRQVVERFGERMKRVSTLAPDSIAARAVREAYSGLVTPALLERWSADPTHAPGKDVSSPWPERIRIDSVAAIGAGECRVAGEIVYLTSVEEAKGGAAALVPVTLRVASDGGWKVGAFDAAPPASVPAGTPSASPAARTDSSSAATTADSTLTPAEVIRRYYAAIDARDYRRAYELWGNGGAASGQSFDDFRAGFARTAGVAVEVGEVGRVEGAAGSRYVDVPVVVRATTTGGGTQRFEGSYTLRRTVVDGSTAAQRRWHIDSAKLSPAR
jgi:hypothetical protein